MLIILEGPDGAGKTHLAQRLVTHLALTEHDGTVTMLKAGPPTRHPLDEYVNPLLEYVPSGSDHIICDRWHVGEWVYPRVKGRPTRMDPAVLHYVELFLESKGAVTVIVNPPAHTLQRRVVERGDDYVRVGELPALHEAYQIRNLPVLRTLRYSFTYPTALAPEAVVDSARRTARTASRLDPYVTPVGSPTPEVLLFGELRGCDGVDCDHRRRHLTSGPAFMPYPATSGHYLLRALHEAGVVARVALANTCDVDHPFAVWATLGQPPAIALGRTAHRALKIADVPHAVVPHPQYVRRFHHRESRGYGRLIEALIGTEEDRLSWRP